MAMEGDVFPPSKKNRMSLCSFRSSYMLEEEAPERAFQCFIIHSVPPIDGDIS